MGNVVILETSPAWHYVQLDSEQAIVLDTIVLNTGTEVAIDYRLEPEESMRKVS
jgi:hypothetical protein